MSQQYIDNHHEDKKKGKHKKSWKVAIIWYIIISKQNFAALYEKLCNMNGWLLYNKKTIEI